MDVVVVPKHTLNIEHFTTNHITSPVKRPPPPPPPPLTKTKQCILHWHVWNLFGHFGNFYYRYTHTHTRWNSTIFNLFIWVIYSFIWSEHYCSCIQPKNGWSIRVIIRDTSTIFDCEGELLLAFTLCKRLSRNGYQNVFKHLSPFSLPLVNPSIPTIDSPHPLVCLQHCVLVRVCVCVYEFCFYYYCWRR